MLGLSVQCQTWGDGVKHMSALIQLIGISVQSYSALKSHWSLGESQEMSGTLLDRAQAWRLLNGKIHFL